MVEDCNLFHQSVTVECLLNSALKKKLKGIYNAERCILIVNLCAYA